MKRTFLWNFAAVVPILEFDFRVTIVALQAVRGHIIDRGSWPRELSSEQHVLANFLDLQITPLFLPVGTDFKPFEHRYTLKITELTGFHSSTKNFQSDGKTLRDFAEHRLGTSIEGALFLCLKNLSTTGQVSIPSLSTASETVDLLKLPVTETDLIGISKAMETITNPQLETGSKIIKMNPTIEQEFPNLSQMAGAHSLSKSFEELVSVAVSPKRLVALNA